MSLMPGARLGPYVIEAPLGAGGMGEVYRAKDMKLDRDVAIKVLPGSFALDAIAARGSRASDTFVPEKPRVWMAKFGVTDWDLAPDGKRVVG